MQSKEFASRITNFKKEPSKNLSNRRTSEDYSFQNSEIGHPKYCSNPPCSGTSSEARMTAKKLVVLGKTNFEKTQKIFKSQKANDNQFAE